MTITVQRLAAQVSGRVIGNPSHTIEDAQSFEFATEMDLTFLGDDQFVKGLPATKAGAVLLREAHAPVAEEAGINAIVVRDPQLAFTTLLPHFRRAAPVLPIGIHPSAVIDPTAKIATDAAIGPLAVVGPDVEIGSGCQIHAGVVIGSDCRLDADVTLYPQVVLYHGIRVGQRVIIHAHAVIGADGFGYRFDQGEFKKIPQLGHVVIEDDVEIGACTTVDRGAVGPTVIGRGTKLDNLVMVAHNCRVGRHNVFASQVGMAGSSQTGDYVRLGGQTGLRDHITVHSGASIGAKAGVRCDVPAGETWIGIPATPEAEQKRLLFSVKRVPDMRDDVKELKKIVAQLQSRLEALTKEDRRAA